MTIKKAPLNKTANYIASKDQNDFTRDKQNYLGKVRSNFVGSEFMLYDDGFHPKK